MVRSFVSLFAVVLTLGCGSHTDKPGEKEFKAASKLVRNIGGNKKTGAFGNSEEATKRAAIGRGCARSSARRSVRTP